MKKSLYLLVTIVASAIFLVACSSKQSMDGTYYEFRGNKDDLILSKVYTVKISEDTLVQSIPRKTFTIKQENHTLVGDDIFEYELKDDVLSYDGNTYVKAGTTKEKEIAKKAKEVLEK